MLKEVNFAIFNCLFIAGLTFFYVIIRQEEIVVRYMHLNTPFLRKTLTILILVFVAGSTFSIAITQTALTLAVVCWIVIMVCEKKVLIPRTPTDYFFFGYFLVGLLSLIFAQNEGAAVNFVKRLLLIPIVYLIAASISDKKSLKYTLLALIGSMVILSIIGIQKYLSGIGGLEGRLKLYHHYMTSGGILMFVSLITFAFVSLSVPVKVRIAALLSGILMLFPLLFTFTRSSWLGFLGGILFLGVLQSRKFLFGCIIALILFYLLGPQTIKDRAFSIVDPNHPNNIERVYLWEAGIEMVKDYPLTGVGDIDLGELYMQYRSPEARQQQGHMHNNFLMFAVTLGVPGFIVMMALFIRIFTTELRISLSIPREEWLLRSTALGSLAAFIGFQINGLFEWNFGDAEIAMLLWLTVGLTFAVERIQKSMEYN